MTAATRRAISADSGFTLIELLVALALFALISLAGVSLIETTLGVQQRTDGRSERLAEIQRALYLVTVDLEQLTAGPLPDPAMLSFQRASSGGDYSVSYYLADGAVHRVAAGTDRIILSNISVVEWRFFKNGAWTDQPSSQEAPQRPSGVELVLQLDRSTAFVGGTLRRVIELPAEP